MPLAPLGPATSRSLLIVRAGQRSTHGPWLTARRGFDILVSAYEDLPEALTAGAIAAPILPGPKVASWRDLFAAYPEIFERYDQIALLDDDLFGSAVDIDAAFVAGRTHSLSLWQPSLSWDSYFSYGIVVHNPVFQLRYVNFVEMMCPFFSAEHLQSCLPLLNLGYETTIDRLWCRMRQDSHKAYAIIDSVQLRHSRPVGVNAEAQGFSRANAKKGNMYQSVIDRTEQELGVVFRGPVAYGGILRGGREVGGRLVMASLALAPFLAWRRKVNKRFYRPLADHVRHNLTRPIDNALLQPGILAQVTPKTSAA